MTNSKHVPKRRFKEFESDGEWERDLFGKIADFSIKTNSFSREKLTHESYEVQNIHYGDILIKFQSILDLKRDNLPSIIDSNVLDFSQSLLQDGDVIFADAAEDSTVGKAIEIRNIMEKNVVSGLHTIAARPIQLFAPYYLGYYLNSDFYHKQIIPLMQGTKVSSISKSNLQVTEISFPIINEQKKLGKYFQTIDSLISLHQHKLEKLKNLKKAYLSEMFPAEGERVPHRRFPGFEGEWEERKLTEVTEVITKGTTPRDKSWNGPVNYIKTESINSESGKLVRTSSTTLEEHEGYLTRSKLKTGDVLFSIVGTLGRVGIVEEEDLPANTNQQIAIIRLLSSSSEFVMYSLKTTSVKSFIKTDATIGAQPSISLWQIEELKLLFPTITEQEAISSYFKVLDRLITLQQQKLDKLNDLKKAYLNELFV